VAEGGRVRQGPTFQTVTRRLRAATGQRWVARPADSFVAEVEADAARGGAAGDARPQGGGARESRSGRLVA
jgi:hypothetical protein